MIVCDTTHDGSKEVEVDGAEEGGRYTGFVALLVVVALPAPEAPAAVATVVVVVDTSDSRVTDRQSTEVISHLRVTA